MAIKDKEDNMLLDRNECLQRWTQYFSEVYEDNDQESQELVDALVKISPPPRDDSMDEIGYEEVKMPIKGLKNRKVQDTME